MSSRLVNVLGALLVLSALAAPAVATPIAMMKAEGKKAEGKVQDKKADRPKGSSKPEQPVSSGNVESSSNALVGNADKEDVRLAGRAADGFTFLSGVNTGNGKLDPIVFPGQSNWSFLAKGDQLVDNALSFTAGSLLFNFSKSGATTGAWSVTNTSDDNATTDLLLSIHAGNASGAFFFDNQSILAGQKLTGSWSIEWFNNSNNENNPGFSNFAFFQRDLILVDSQEGPGTGLVPEPGSLALLGLGLLGMSTLRKRRKA